MQTTQAAEPKQHARLRVYIGTYTGEQSKGIYTATLDVATGKLSQAELAAEVNSPSFLTVHPSNKYLYAVSEISELDGKPTGGISAYAMDAASGKLTLLNQQPSEGGGPCHLTVDATGKALLVANYGGGSVASFPILDGGKLGPAASAIQHAGSSVDKGRQEGPHAHSINVDPTNQFAMAADLGLDQVLVYRLDPNKATLTPHDPPYASVAAGSGPRHFAFHPSGKFAYVINEMLLTVTAFKYDGDQGKLTEVQTISTLPADVSVNETLSTAEVQVHPSGKFLYGSNRGHDTLAIFSIDPASGKLTAVGHQPTGGKTPRNFGIDPTGTFVLAANQDSASVVAFRVDQKTGKLKETGESLTVGMPVCVKFVPIP